MMTQLCRIILKMFPPRFQTEFAAEIIAAFHDHYREEKHRGTNPIRLFLAQSCDLWDLLRAALIEQQRTILSGFSGKRLIGDEGVEVEMSNHRIVWRVYFAWQARQEAEWLREMSRQGWEFVDYKWFRYYFRKQDPPKEYEFFFERNLFPWWQMGDEARYLESKTSEGWEFAKYFLMWYYFRRPVRSDTPSAILTENVPLIPTNSSYFYLISLFFILLLFGIPFILSGFNPGVFGDLLLGLLTGVGIAVVIMFILGISQKK